MALTITQVENEKRPGKHFDGEGMYLLVTPDGAKYWRFKYRFAGKEKLLALGVYPDTGLKLARTKRTKAREQLAEGKDPGALRQAEKRAARQNAENTFKAIALEWASKRGGKWSDAHRSAIERRLEVDLVPKLGRLPIASIDSPQLLEVLRGIESRGAHEVAGKCRTIAGQVFRYAIATSRATRDPTPDLKGALEVVEKRHHARLSESDLPEFLKKLEAYDGTAVTKLAIKLLMLTMVRTGELREAMWDEFDLGKREWKIPAKRMKGREPHIVPLSDQAVEVLQQLKPLTGKGALVFPNEYRDNRPMSENTILFALYRMGYRGRATGHGMRATASTILNEQKDGRGHRLWNADAIERQLAHREKDKIRAAYHHAEYMPERKRMMQAWADFLDAKQFGGDTVVSIARKRA